MKVFKGIFKKAVVLLIVVLLSATTANAQNVQNFTIESFHGDYYLTKNDKNVSQLKVTETITAIFPNFNQNHGIERAIPKTYKDNNLNLKIESIKKSDGSKWNYSDRTVSDNLILRIGDADKYLQGEQTFVISYTLRDVMTFYDSHDEFYWDVNGDQWQQPFSQVSATIHLPSNVSSTIKNNAKCFTGSFGSTNANCEVAVSKEGDETQISVQTNRALFPRETMSVVVGFNSGTFTKYKTDPWVILLLIIGVASVLLFPPLLVGVIMYRRWSKSGKDPKGKGIIVPQYSAPKNMNPILADLVLNERLQTKAISASLIDLCVRGYIKLYEVEKKKLIGSNQEYEVELIKPTQHLTSEEQKVVSMIFSSTAVSAAAELPPSKGERVNLNNLKNKLYKDVKVLSKMASRTATDKGYFIENPETARKKYSGWGVALLIFGLAPIFFFPPAVLATIGIAAAGAIVLIFGNAMPKRTQAGVEMREYLLGIKDYMKLAEAERIKFLQAPGTAEKLNVNDSGQLVKLYEKLLPYAILYGIEKDWAKQFADLYKDGESPNWYSGHSAFNAAMFSNAVTNFNSAATSSFTSPSSSGSSGFSSGGGFSGGGGGGGGGGGW